METIMNVTALLGLAFPPLWIITIFCAIALAMRDKKPKGEPWPCPRCAYKHVQLFEQPGRSWKYFTCGACGARGYYPFHTLQQRMQHLGPLA